MICLKKKKIKTEIILVKEKKKDNYWKKANYRTKFKKSKRHFYFYYGLF